MKVEDSSLNSSSASREVLWSFTADPIQPYEAKMGADTWTIRVNDFPDEHLFTLLINGHESESFDDWPASWTRPQPDGANPLESLSAREYEVFTLLVEGVRVKEIAARLQISPKTVDTYRASLMRKLDIRDVSGLEKYAVRRNPASSR